MNLRFDFGVDLKAFYVYHFITLTSRRSLSVFRFVILLFNDPTRLEKYHIQQDPQSGSISAGFYCLFISALSLEIQLSSGGMLRSHFLV